MKTNTLALKTAAAATFLLNSFMYSQDLVSLNVGTTLPQYTYDASSKVVTAQMTVRNTGFANSNAFDVALFLKDVNSSTEYEIDRSNYSGLSYNQLGNANTLYITNWTINLSNETQLPGGTYKVQARINDNQNAYETNYTNNQENFGNASFTYVQAVTGIKENASSFQASVFPNPSTGIFRLELHNEQLTSSKLTVDIYNALGEKVYSTFHIGSESSFDVDLSHQAKGLYFIKLSSEEKSVTQKLILK